MQPQISGTTFDSFFAWAPLVIGLCIYAVFFIAKRHETANGAGMPIGQTFACAGCGRRGHREHMSPREHSGAVSWYCSRCSGAH